MQTLRGVFLGQARGQDHQSLRWRQLVNGSFGYPDSTPVFIVGMPRSGSSLIESMLAAHPSVWAAGEDTALARFMPQLIDILTSGRWLTDAGAKVSGVCSVDRGVYWAILNCCPVMCTLFLSAGHT